LWHTQGVSNEPTRCGWAGTDPLSIAYHDTEWGVPSHDETHLFEMLTLEGAQSGLSWMTILRKREGYRRAFADFDANAVAAYDERDVERLMQDASIVRNRLKIESTIANARACLALRDDAGGLDAYVWSFVDGAPLQNAWPEISHLPAQSELSKRMSKELARRGFRFLGPTTVYSFMQATGMVNDHVTSCLRYAELNNGA
jgi:DNA-3-methyladenine glycosylase I